MAGIAYRDPHGGFYRHFTSRDDLVAEAVRRMTNEFESVVREDLPAEMIYVAEGDG
jgi:AcrR family transcriptional regulator